MKKSNWVLLAITVVVSAFLLWLWFFLGFNRIDSPLDLVLSIMWWVVIGLAIFAIVKVEAARRKRIRTIYVAQHTLFNAEAGTMNYVDEIDLANETEAVLEDLKYGFDHKDLPDKEEFRVKAVIRTDKYKEKKKRKDPEDEQATSQQSKQKPKQGNAQESSYDNKPVWKGEVVFVEDQESHHFDSKTELIGILIAA